MTEYRYFYNGKLRRTSHRIYTHGVYDAKYDQLNMCSSTYQGAVKLMRASGCYDHRPGDFSIVELTREARP